MALKNKIIVKKKIKSPKKKNRIIGKKKNNLWLKKVLRPVIL